MAKAAQPAKNGMDYPEHEKTYTNFLWLTKWSIIHLVTLLIAMAAGFFGGFGFIGGLLIFIVLNVIAYFTL